MGTRSSFFGASDHVVKGRERIFHIRFIKLSLTSGSVDSMKAVLLFFAVVSTLAGQDKSAIRNAQVTLPYSEVRDLIDLAHQREKKQAPELPPVSALVSQVQYTLQAQAGGGAKGKAVFKIQSLVKTWQAIELLDSRLTVTKVEPSEAILVRQGDWLALALSESGPTTVTIEFFAPGHRDELFRFMAVPAILSSLDILEDGGLPIKLNGAESAGGPPSLYHLPPGGGEVSGTRRMVKEVAERLTPTKWEATTESLVMPQPDVLKISTRVQLFTGEPEAGNVAHLRIPKLAVLERVTSAKMDRYDLKAGSDPGSRLLEIVWESGGLANRQVELSYEIPRPLNQGVWKLELPALIAPLVTQGTLAIIPPDELNLTASSAKVLDLRLPAWMAREADGGAPLMIGLSGEQVVSLEVEPKKRLLAAMLTITSAKYDTQMVKGGDLLTGGELKIEHERGASWDFTLPEGATLLSCRLDDSPVSPIIRSDGKLELPLKNPDGNSVVKLSYTTKTKALDPVEGSSALALLQTDAFCHSQSWAIALPSGYETTAVDGNIPFDPTPPRDHRLHLLKKLSQGQVPQAQIYYRKKSLDQ